VVSKLHKDDVRGWVGSVVLHLIVGLIFFLWRMDFSLEQPEFIEVSWGAIADVPTVAPARAALGGSEGARVTMPRPSTRSIELPERSLNLGDDVLQTPRSRKIEADDTPTISRMQVAEASTGQKDRSAGLGLGDKEQFATTGSGDQTGRIAEPSPTGNVGSDISPSVSVSMTWSDGGLRSKLSGEMPTYPAGVNVETQIRIETVVAPDGSVKSLKPAQKGNTRLEDAAMRAVRLWKFEPLRQSVPQVDQVCLITFNFALK
jgi:TonB family protein